MFRFYFRYFSVLLVILGLSGMAQAEDKKASREREALRRAQQQVQKATQDLAGLQEKLNAAETENAELSGAQARASVESGRAKKLQQQLQALTTEHDALLLQSAGQKTASEQRVLQLSTQLSKLERDLAAAQDKGTQLEAVQVNQTRQIASCEDRNAKLYAVGRATIEECRDRSVKDTVLRLEPFTGIGRVAIENRLEAERDLLDAQKTQSAPLVN